MSKQSSNELRKRFPSLAVEVEERKQALKIDAVRTDLEQAEKVSYQVQGYEPTVIDFIRRCDTEQQALEIIGFLESRGELSPEYARRLSNQLARLGLRSFGPKRNPGCYE